MPTPSPSKKGILLWLSSCICANADRSAVNSPLTTDTINPAVLRAQYAVRGELVLRAAKMKMVMKEQPDAFDFEKIVEVRAPCSCCSMHATHAHT